MAGGDGGIEPEIVPADTAAPATLISLAKEIDTNSLCFNR